MAYQTRMNWECFSSHSKRWCAFMRALYVNQILSRIKTPFNFLGIWRGQERLESLNTLLSRIGKLNAQQQRLPFIIRAALTLVRGRTCPILLNYVNFIRLKSIWCLWNKSIDHHPLDYRVLRRITSAGQPPVVTQRGAGHFRFWHSADIWNFPFPGHLAHSRTRCHSVRLTSVMLQ